jgi:amino acid adenylation domain-containing protein
MSPEPSRELFVFPTTYSQRQLWYLQAAKPDSSAYNIPLAFELRGQLDGAALSAALQALAARHDILRTCFRQREDRIEQVVDSAVSIELEVLGCDALAESERAAAVATEKLRIARHVFDLSQPPLVIARLLVLGPQRHVLLLCLHHILVDHWSVLQFGRELEALYSALRRGGDAGLSEPELQYPDYAVWQQEALDAEALQARLPAFVEALRDYPRVLDVFTDHPRPTQQSFVGSEVRLAFDAELSAGLRAYAQQRQQTLFTVLLAGVGLLLRGLCGHDRLIVGCPFANRGAEELEQVMGLFMNLLPVGIEVDPERGFDALVAEVRRRVMRVQGLQDTPFEKLVQALGVHRDPARNPLVQTWFTFQDAPMALRLDGLEVESEALPNGGSKLDLSWWFWDDGERLQGLIEYDSALFEAGTMERYGQRLQALLRQAIAQPQAPVGGFSLVAAEEREALQAASTAPAPRRDWRSPHAPFFSRAQRDPQRIVLRAADGELDAGTLAARADAIAAALRERGIGRGDVVALCCPRDSRLVASLLGVLRAGAAYLPIDPDLPDERIAYLLEDAGAQIAIATPELTAHFATLAVEVLDPAVLRAAPPEFEPAAEDPAALAYLIYTSGSTGRPKGVRIPCGAVGNFLASMVEQPGLGEDDRLLALTTCAFDIAVLEIFGALASGALLVLGDRQLLENPVDLIHRIESESISVLQATPATWRLLRAAGWEGSSRLRALCGGEPLGTGLAAWLLPRVAELWNLYGPTESTVWSSLQRIGEDQLRHCPIGLPIASTGLHVLDAQRRVLPAGVIGELAITGAGLAEGYHRREALTAERFFTLPESGERAYLTGDRVLREPCGRLRHLGRADHQLKIRGFRIEPGEIEACLCALPGIGAAVVGEWRIDESDQRLVAWVAVEPGAEPEIANLRRELGRSLPAYMLPQHVVALSALPRLPNGKLDRAALPWPSDAAAPGAAQTPIRAASVDEGLDASSLQVLEIARELLGSDAVELSDNFFDAGGHSMLALQFAARLEQASGLRLPLLSIAQGSLGLLAEELRTRAGAADSDADAAPPQAQDAPESRPGLGQRFARLLGFGDSAR